LRLSLQVLSVFTIFKVKNRTYRMQTTLNLFLESQNNHISRGFLQSFDFQTWELFESFFLVSENSSICLNNKLSSTRQKSQNSVDGFHYSSLLILFWFKNRKSLLWLFNIDVSRHSTIILSYFWMWRLTVWHSSSHILFRFFSRILQNPYKHSLVRSVGKKKLHHQEWENRTEQ